MVTKAEIKVKYAEIHDGLTRRYYVEKSLDKATFEAQHSKCWRDLQQELLDNGFLERSWQYSFGALISTAVGDFDIEVNIDSPIQLTVQQIKNNISRLKTADWEHRKTTQRFREV